MRAFVVTAPQECAVPDVPPPTARDGEVVVDVERAGVCGTDVEFWTGGMQYLHDGNAAYPMRLGHEWSGTVSAVGTGVERRWLGRRVTGDTMLGCGACSRCTTGRQHVCDARSELGIRGGRPGALAEQVAVPVTSLVELPEQLDPAAGALVEPGGNALRAVQAADLTPGDRALVLGAGTIGLLVALFARADGAEIHLVDRSERARSFARDLGFPAVASTDELPDLPLDAVVDASTAAALPARAVELVEPGKRVVYIGLSGSPSLLDTRALVLKDVTAVGVLSGSPGLRGAAERYATGAVDPRPLVAATVGLDAVGDVLAGRRPDGSGAGPKVHVDPTA